MTFPVLAASNPSGYTISRSVRLRSSASAYLNRTFGTPTDNKKWTMSLWLKRGQLPGTIQNIFARATSSPNQQTKVQFDVNNCIEFELFDTSAYVGRLVTTQVFRDPSAWYHLVFIFDSNNATSSSRMQIWVNGVQVTSFSTSSYPASGQVSYWNTSGSDHAIGTNSPISSANQYLDGYLTEINFIDGQALTPTSFGAYNSTTGVWQPIKYTGTYGTNGFYLTFADNSAATAAAIGKDYSGNGNNWTTNNISLTAGSTYDSMTDVPTLTSATAANYCVMNPLNTGSNITLSGGNLNLSQNGSAGISKGTIAVSSGKWYWECTLLSGTGESYGIARDTALPTTTYVGYSADTWGYQSVNGKSYNNIAGGGTAQNYGATWTTNDIIGVALDLDAGTLTFYKNGTSQGVAFTGLSGTFTPAIGNDASHTDCANFGQRPFSYTPPSGFVALNTYNL